MTQSPLSIAVDGPAGAGKSTVVQALAQQLGLLYLDTGAMYRAATLALLATSIDLDDSQAIAAWCQKRTIDFDALGQVRVDGTTIDPQALRSRDTTKQIWRIADNPECRKHLVHLQQAIVSGRDVALEGRDATTVICPQATLKVYLDASPEERARRRMRDWPDQKVDFADLVRELRERDQRDMQRSSGALKQADDAVRILSDGMPIEEVIATIMARVVQRRPMVLESRVSDQVLVGRSRQAGYVRVAQGSINIPPAPWQLGLTNPSPDRLPHNIQDFTRNHGGRQAGVLCQGQAVLALAGCAEQPGAILAMPILPQTWYVIEPEAWHAVIQVPGSICAWAEASHIQEERCPISPAQQGVLQGFLRVYLPSAFENEA